MWRMFWTGFYSIKWKIRHMEDTSELLFLAICWWGTMITGLYLAWGWINGF